jgi:hypothetical protein
MSILPSRTQDLLDWFNQRGPVWIEQAINIGITSAQATAFNTKATAARNAYNARLAALEAARVAANVQRDAITDARRNASDLLRIIKAFAENQANPQIVYDRAQIPAPAVPSPAPPPAKPSDITVELTPTSGAITLRWKASNPVGTQGTSYIVRRRTSAAAEFAFIGVTGTKEFVDSTFFAGPDSVQYTVQGQRADSAGPVSDILTINFGRGPGVQGQAIQSVDGGTVSHAVKLAA